MPFPPSEKSTPLRDLRRALGLSLCQVVDRGGALSETFPRSTASMAMLETRSTVDVRVIEVLASVYGVPFDSMRDVCERSRSLWSRSGRPRGARSRRVQSESFAN